MSKFIINLQEKYPFLVQKIKAKYQLQSSITNGQSIEHVCHLQGDNLAYYITVNLGHNRTVGDSLCSD